ncbi:MAG TPA: hypothetical protein VMX17_01895 [Candidatus Glassbacteria bacterium]|jgi:hypothetical protein|nr:hypothetical protein [Candidatus Glassbacteria bacterium]
MEKLRQLLDDGHIEPFDYKTYLMFGNTAGSEYIKTMIELFFMEESPVFNDESSFAFIDGRRSVWRDIKNSIAMVEAALEFENRRDVNN